MLLLLATLTFGFYGYLPPGETIEAYLVEQRGRVVATGYLGSLSAMLLLWFSGSIYAYLRSREGDPGRLAMIAFGGGIASATALALAFTVMVGAGMRAGAEGGIGTVGAMLLYDLWGNAVGSMFGFTMAVLIAATALSAMRTAAWPAWAGWLSLLIAVGLLTPVAYLVLVAALLWLVVLSVSLYLRPPSPNDVT